MHDVLDFVFHLDTHLAAFVASYGLWVYGLLFAIVFAETGLVVTPFDRGGLVEMATEGRISAAGHQGRAVRHR